MPILQLRPGLESGKCVEAYRRMREIVAELRDRRARPRRRSSAPARTPPARRVLAFENTNAVARYAANQTIVFGEDIDPDAAIALLDEVTFDRGGARSPPASPTSCRWPASGPHTVEELASA